MKGIETTAPTPRQPIRQRGATGLEADEHDLLEATVALDDLVGHSGQRPLDLLCVEHLGPGDENAPERGRTTSFAFGHAMSFLSVWASRTRFTVRRTF